MKLKAFTLVELVLTIAMMGILAVGLGIWLQSSVKSYDLVTTRKQLVTQARSGLEVMRRELRLIPGSAQVTSISATSFQFQYPIGTSITYSLAGGVLKRNNDALINGVTALTFSYYDDTGAVTTLASEVRSVGIQFTTLPTTSADGITLRTRVFLRNTGSKYANFTSP